MDYMTPHTGPIIAKIHYFWTFLFSLMELMNANNTQMSVMMSWSLSNTTNWTMNANVTLCGSLLFHVNLCTLLLWKQPHRIMGSTDRVFGCENPFLQTNLATKSFYACPVRKPKSGGPEDSYCSSWGCENNRPWVKNYGRDKNLIGREGHKFGQQGGKLNLVQITTYVCLSTAQAIRKIWGLRCATRSSQILNIISIQKFSPQEE